MSVKQLKFKNLNDTMDIEGDADNMRVETYNEWSDRSNHFYLDRNQAHLLYLYLKERFEP